MTKIPRRVLRTVRLAALPLLVLAALASCNLMGSGPLTIKECITDFSNGYTGGNYSTLYTYFSSVGTSMYSQIKPATYWDLTPFASGNGPDALSGYTINSTTVTGTFTNANGTYDLSITMEQDGLYWYIKTLDLTDPTNGGASVLSIS